MHWQQNRTEAGKTQRAWHKVFLSAFLAGTYIAFGGLVAIAVSSGMRPTGAASSPLTQPRMPTGCRS